MNSSGRRRIQNIHHHFLFTPLMAVYSFSTLFFKEEMYFYFIFNSLDIPARCCCFFSSVDVLGCPIEGEGKEKRLGTPKYGRQSIGGEKK